MVFDGLYKPVCKWLIWLHVVPNIISRGAIVAADVLNYYCSRAHLIYFRQLGLCWLKTSLKHDIIWYPRFPDSKKIRKCVMALLIEKWNYYGKYLKYRKWYKIQSYLSNIDLFTLYAIVMTNCYPINSIVCNPSIRSFNSINCKGFRTLHIEGLCGFDCWVFMEYVGPRLDPLP